MNTASLGAGALRALADRHGIRPKRSLGQHFLIDPNLARAIASDAGVGPGDRVVEIGAGLGSLTRALAEAGAEVLAVEVDPSLIPALEESVAGLGSASACCTRMRRIASGRTSSVSDEWVLAANLPYNVATHLVLDTLRDVPQVRRLVVMVQREVGERLVGGARREGLRDPQRPGRLPGRGDPRAPRAAVGVLAPPQGGVGDRAARAPGRAAGRRSTRSDSGRWWMPGSPSGGRRCGTRSGGSAWRARTRTRSWRRPGSTPRLEPRRSRSRSSRGSRRPCRLWRIHPRRLRNDGAPDMTALQMPAHAKLNVFLRVLGRRDDGYHDVETLLLPISLADDVTVEPADELTLSLEGPAAEGVPADDTNLALRAARALAAEAGGAQPPGARHHDRQAHPGRRRPRRRFGRRRRDPAAARRAVGRRLGSRRPRSTGGGDRLRCPGAAPRRARVRRGARRAGVAGARAVDDVGREAVRVRRVLGGRVRVVGRASGDGSRRGSPDRRGGGRQQRPPRERPLQRPPGARRRPPSGDLARRSRRSSRPARRVR